MLMTHNNKPSLINILKTNNPNKKAIIVPNEDSFTYSELTKNVNKLTKQLIEFGIKKNDRVAIYLTNKPETIIIFLAISEIATAAPLNPAYTASEVQFYMEDINAKYLITSEEPKYKEAFKGCPSNAHIITINYNNNEFCLIQNDNLKNKSIEKNSSKNNNSDDVALILHTSGTTSRPKRVPLSHKNIYISIENISESYNLTSKDISLCIMPLFHIHGLVASTLSTLFTGGTIILPEKFNALNFWEIIRSYKITWVSAVPAIHQTALTRIKTNSNPKEYTKNLRFIRSCSSPLSAQTMLEMEKILNIPVLEAYGMTEAAHQMSSNPFPPDKRIPGTVGKGTNVDIAIMDNNDNLLSNGQQGEIVIKGENVIHGYEDNPEANASSFSKGWFRTGDEGIIDEEGYIRIVGRIKELINKGGEKISPIEIDETLLLHPAVTEAVAFAIPHKTYGEEPSAAVVIKSPITEKDLIKHCKEKLAAFKCPRSIKIVDSIPRTATGKIQRRIVAEQFSKSSE